MLFGSYGLEEDLQEDRKKQKNRSEESYGLFQKRSNEESKTSPFNVLQTENDHVGIVFIR